MIVPQTRIRVCNAKTGAEHVVLSPLPRWLIADRLAEAGGIVPLVDESWVLLIFDVGITDLTLHLLPTAFPRLVEKVRDLAQARAWV